MKAISLTDTDWEEGRPRAVLPMMVYADSAIGRDVQPLFIPDIAPHWMCHVCVAVRVGRLGKCISERFADRYVDALGLVAVIEPEGAEAVEMRQNGVLSIMDSAVTTGRWTETAGLPSGLLTMTVGDQIRSYEIDDLRIAQIISRVSRGATLKTGDMLILGYTGFTLPLVTNTWIRASLSGVVDLPEALRIKVK